MSISQITLAGIVVLSLFVLGFWGFPQYNVYTQRKEGEAMLAHAQSSREVAVAEAKAKMESATLLAQADTIRAHGIARSNQIIGQSLTPAYLHWFWIDNIDKSNNVIYVQQNPIYLSWKLEECLIKHKTLRIKNERNN